MTDAEKLAAIKSMMETNLVVSLRKPGTMRQVYLLITDGAEPPVRVPKERPVTRQREARVVKKPKMIVTANYLKRRFGIVV